MPSTHRGVPVPGNHRPTPRLVQMMAHELGRFWGGAIPEEYRDATAQNMIDSHRAGVEKGQYGSGSTPFISHVIKNRSDIADAIAEDKYQKAMWSTPSPREAWGMDDGKRSYLYDYPEKY